MILSNKSFNEILKLQDTSTFCTFLISTCPAVALTGLFTGSITFKKILLFSLTKAPFHLLGLNEQIGVRASNDELRGKIGP